ncbi:single-stranded DNA-binding protein [Corynebacterium aquilae]|uniref:single-stranded DNA-binding protein n=1 Tax=Corynebacterium aquilae TaxID=203263 RepID=UPI0009529EAD|nr:single-stranded DNA-binding protein [Corynebacterium aquilae]
MAQTIIVGNLGKTPELKTSQAGKPYATFSVAWTESTRDSAGQWVDGPVTWVHVTCFGRTAQNVANCLTKGDRVLVTGDMKLETWHSDQGANNIVTLRADNVAPDLTFATVQINRNAPTGGGYGGQQSGGFNQQPAQNTGGFSNQQPQADAWNSQPQPFATAGEQPPF